MSGNNDVSFNGIKWNFDNLPNEIDLTKCSDENIKKILSVFDTDKKKGVLSKDEIIKAVSFFAQNDKFKDENEKYFNISDDDAELIARNFDGGKYLGKEIKKAFDYMKGSFAKVQTDRDTQLKRETLAPLLNQIKEKELTLLDIRGLLNDGMNSFYHEVLSQIIERTEESDVWFDKTGNVYTVKQGKLEKVDGAILKLDDKSCVYNTTKVEDEHGYSYYVNKGVYKDKGSFVQICDFQGKPIDNPEKAAELAGVKAETDGWFLFEGDPIGRFDVYSENGAEYYKIWNSSNNCFDDCEKIVNAVKYFDAQQGIYYLGNDNSAPTTISQAPWRLPVTSKSEALEQYLLNRTEVVEENGERVCKFLE